MRWGRMRLVHPLPPGWEPVIDDTLRGGPAQRPPRSRCPCLVFDPSSSCAMSAAARSSATPQIRSSSAPRPSRCSTRPWPAHPCPLPRQPTDSAPSRWTVRRGHVPPAPTPSSCSPSRSWRSTICARPSTTGCARCAFPSLMVSLANCCRIGPRPRIGRLPVTIDARRCRPARDLWDEVSSTCDRAHERLRRPTTQWPHRKLVVTAAQRRGHRRRNAASTTASRKSSAPCRRPASSRGELETIDAERLALREAPALLLEASPNEEPARPRLRELEEELRRRRNTTRICSTLPAQRTCV